MHLNVVSHLLLGYSALSMLSQPTQLPDEHRLREPIWICTTICSSMIDKNYFTRILGQITVVRGLCPTKSQLWVMWPHFILPLPSITSMTGFSLPTPPEEEGLNQHHRNFKGISRILGPKWAQFPTITAGLLGVQILWSVEMTYGVCANILTFFFLKTCQLHPIYFPWAYPIQAWLVSSLQDPFLDL